ncbi:MAG: hypothetical protein NT067_00395 [Candidatus Diapherotrites archaeon]|nr:hypothetical protein [Candidatus Diapherotrites archaeon]
MDTIVPALFCIIFIGMIAAFALSESKPQAPESTPCGTASCPASAGNLQATATPSPAPTVQENTALQVQITGFSTDKNVYSSSQQLKASIVLNASKGAGGITARLHGINANGSDKVDETKTIDVNAGHNTIEFLETTPYCTAGCGGVFPGPYDLFFEVSDESGLLAQASATIELVKG